ncbi:hypothetical protein LTS18_006046 [Coniosporium uncinatum]|uniref:Uncharacterized protein n=1 Tax=Coniosporium uncinatum TaxID=93489 RepID=A0ACC3DQR4_9PEZI|nr:hypothetical protein LTS18_006046 [Coniosporium uncinatum]
MSTYQPQPIGKAVRQSPPVDLSKPYSDAWLKDKHILITGGANGFGAGFVRRWAAASASVVVGDVNIEKGTKLVTDVRKELGNRNVHFVHCDVRDWDSQVNLFKEAVKLSPHGGIDIVVPNAGVADMDTLQTPTGLDAAEPPKPNFRVMDVNLYGVLYTVHLAMFWLPKNPGSKDAGPTTDPASSKRDRSILLVGSMASLAPIAGQPLYGAAKHGVLGLFRSLRTSSFAWGVRVNLLCPYFIDTDIVPMSGRMVLAGGATGKVEDVVEAGTRFVADASVCGRSLIVGPKVKVQEQPDGEMKLVKKEEEGKETAIWEAYADEFEDSELFMRRIVAVLNTVQSIRGWAGWVGDIVAAGTYGLKSFFR